MRSWVRNLFSVIRSFYNVGTGVIRGSEAALHQNNGFMTRQDYENLSCRSRSTFASLRSTVYTIFESYLKEKQRRRDYDAADRWQLQIVISPLSSHCCRVYSILNHEMPKRKVDFMWVLFLSKYQELTFWTVTSMKHRITFSWMPCVRLMVVRRAIHVL